MSNKGEKVDIWMPLNVAKYLGDTSRLNTEQHGAYCLLMFDYWMKGPPPDNDSVLASITKLSRHKWKNTCRDILSGFFQIRENKWWHKRIEEELASARENKYKASENGKLGGNPNFKRGQPNPYYDKQKDNPTVISEDKLTDNQNINTIPIPIPISIISKDIIHIPDGVVVNEKKDTKTKYKTPVDKSPVYEGCIWFRMSEAEKVKALDWFKRNSFPPSLLKFCIDEVEGWLRNGTKSGSIKARNNPTHYQQLYASWVIQNASSILKNQKNLNGGQAPRPPNGGQPVRIPEREPVRVGPPVNLSKMVNDQIANLKKKKNEN